jgi:hypothetical protein
MRAVASRCRHALPALLVLMLAACATTSESPSTLPVEPAAKPATKPPPAPKPVPPPPVREEEPVPQPSVKAVDELRRGLLRYDDAEYKEAARHLQRALEMGLPTPADTANARKHLAFMACVAKRTTACRTEFRKAFEADPAFTLAPAEAGHPMWGPVFKSVQAEVAKKRKAAEKKR